MTASLQPEKREPTPGPWKMSDGPYIVRITGEGSVFSGGDWSIFPPPGESGPVAVVNGEANACLIAAAHELLAALKRAENFIAANEHLFPHLEASPTYHEIVAAIAKAEGR